MNLPTHNTYLLDKIKLNIFLQSAFQFLFNIASVHNFNDDNLMIISTLLTSSKVQVTQAT